LADRTPSPTHSIEESHTRRQSLDDSGISGAEPATNDNKSQTPVGDAAKKRVVKRRKKVEGAEETLPPTPKTRESQVTKAKIEVSLFDKEFKQ
jgi:hypothetical protein